jgi:hypothetical protein
LIIHVKIIHKDDSIIIQIKCEDQSKEFFLAGNGYAQSGTLIDGIIEFAVPDKGDYILSLILINGETHKEYFQGISLK